MISKIHTACKDCIFAVYKEKTQVDCKLNKIEKIKKEGLNVIESFDDDKEFFVIDNHICTTYRNELLFKDKTVDEHIELVKKQAKPRIACIVLVKSDNDNELKETIHSIINQSEEFSEVIFLLMSDIKPSKVMNVLEKNNAKFKWSIKQIIDNYWEGSKSINVAIQRSRSTYASVFNSGFIVPKDFVKQICDAIVEDLKRFILLKPIDKDNNALTFQVYAFNALRGNEEAFVDETNEKPVNSFIDKISYIAASQNLTHLIKNCEDICNCIKKN
jgi:hypothetical protein